MRGLILSKAGGDPEVGDFKEPTAAAGQKVVTVLAAALNPVDRYFAMNPDMEAPRVLGVEGVGKLEDGRRVYFERSVVPFGSVAEKSLVADENIIELPEGLETDQALTLGISGLAGWLPLSWKACVLPGEAVLILGATGAQGQIAVQAAKLLGAGKVVAAGRNQKTLEALKARGADDVVVLEGDVTAAIKKAAPEKGFDVVIDSVFGQPFGAVLDSGTLRAQSRVVVLGAGAGQEVTISFRQLQATKGAVISGYSTTYVPEAIRHEAYLTMARHTVAGNLHLETESFPLDRAAEAWAKQATGPHEKIIVKTA